MSFLKNHHRATLILQDTQTQTQASWKVAHDGIKGTTSFGLMLMYSPLPPVNNRWKIHPDWCISEHRASVRTRPCNWAISVSFPTLRWWIFHFSRMSRCWNSLNTSGVLTRSRSHTWQMLNYMYIWSFWWVDELSGAEGFRFCLFSPKGM